PRFLLSGYAAGCSVLPLSVAALAGVEPAEAGLASGLINTSQQIGGALGIPALSTRATPRTPAASAARAAPPRGGDARGARRAAGARRRLHEGVHRRRHRRRTRHRRLADAHPPRRA